MTIARGLCYAFGTASNMRRKPHTLAPSATPAATALPAVRLGRIVRWGAERGAVVDGSAMDVVNVTPSSAERTRA